MQTFLPYANFYQSAKVLDGSRLRKQQTEAEQILKTLRNPTAKGWANHPAVLQWKGYEQALEAYIYAMSEECKARGFKGRATTYPQHLIMPPWLGTEEIHTSHRSRLLFKGRVDAVCSILKKHLKVKSIVAWLLQNGYPIKNTFKYPDVLRLEEFAKQQGLEIPQNHYKQFWNEPDNIPYIWPVKKETVNN